MTTKDPSSLLPPDEGARKPAREPAPEIPRAPLPGTYAGPRAAAPAPPKSPSSLLEGAAPEARAAPAAGKSPLDLLPPAPERPAENLDASPHGPSSLLPPPPRDRRLLYAAIGLAAAFAAAIGVVLLPEEQKSTQELLVEAVKYRAEGDNVAAELQLKNILRRDPDNVDALLLIADAQLATGGLLDAEKALLRAQELGAAPERTYPVLAEILLALDRHDDVLKTLSGEKAVLSASGPRIAVLRGRAYLGLGNLIDARTQFTVARTGLAAEAEAGLARVLLFEGDPDGAREAVDALLDKHPRSVEGLLLKGDLLRGNNDPDGALQAYRKAAEIDPARVEAAVSEIIVLMDQGRLPEAHAALQRMEERAPFSHLVRFAAAALDLREKRFQQAQTKLTEVLRVAPQHMATIMLMGLLSFETGELEQAQNAFLLYLSRYPGNVAARKMYAATLLRKRQPAEAAAALAPFLHLEIRDPGFFAVAGQALLEVGAIAQAKEVLAKAAELKPDNAAILTDLGLAHLRGGSEQTAVAELEKAVSLAPDDPRAYTHLAMTRIARGQIDEGLAVAERLAQRLPKAPEPHWLRGMAHATRNDDAGARRAFEQALAADPAHYPSAAALADLDRKTGDLGPAIARFEALVRRAPGNLDALVALAALAGEAGRLEAGLAHARRAVAEHPGAVAAHMALARLLLQAGKTDDALLSARRAREADPRDPRAVELLGQTLLAANDPGGAVLSFSTLANMQPRYLPGWLQLARAQHANAERRDAIATLRRVLGSAPKNTQALAHLGSLLLETRRHADALALAQAIQRELPELALGHGLEGEARLAQGENEAALVAFRRAMQAQPSGTGAVRLHQAESRAAGKDVPIDSLLPWLEKAPDDLTLRLYTADALVRLGRAHEAVPHYLALHERLPRSIPVLNNLADAFMRLGDPRALDYAQQAFQLKPEDPIVAGTLGAVLLAQGKRYEAVQILQKATRLDPDNPEIRYHFVRALAEAGDRARARSELKALLDSGKRFPQIAEARALSGRL